MIILKFLGYVLSVALITSSVASLIAAMYSRIKYSKGLRITKKSIKLYIRYLLLAEFSFVLAVWVFFVGEYGFSWRWTSGLAIGAFVLMGVTFLGWFIEGLFVAKED